MQKFRVKFKGEAIIEIHDDVIAAVDNEWRAYFYRNLYEPIDIAEHIAYNLVFRRRKLSGLDGWADQPDEKASMLDYPDWEVVASEYIPDEAGQ